MTVVFNDPCYPRAGLGGPDGPCNEIKRDGRRCGADGHFDGYHARNLCGTHLMLAEEAEHKLGRPRVTLHPEVRATPVAR